MSKRQRPDRKDMVTGIGAATGKPQPQTPQSEALRRKPSSREGLVGLTSWHQPAVLKQLKQISAETGIKQQRLVAKALNHLFREYSRPEIADS